MSTEGNRILRHVIYIVSLLFTLSIYGPMAMMSVCAALVILTSIVCWAFDRKPRRRKYSNLEDRIFFSSLLLAVFTIASLAYVTFSDFKFFGEKPFVNWVSDSAKLWHLFFPFFFAGLLGRLTRNQFKWIIKIWLITSVAISLFSILQHYFGLYKPSVLAYLNYPNYVRGSGILERLSGTYHATGFTGSHLSFSAMMIFPFSSLFALTAYLSKTNSKSNIEVFKKQISAFHLTLFGTVVTFISNFLTFSKTGWVALGVATFFLAVFELKKRDKLLVLFCLVVFSGVWILTPEFRYRFQGVASIFSERWVLWKANWEMFKSSPIFGVGWHHNFDLSYAYYKAMNIKEGFSSHAHNNFLDQLSTTGLLGLAAFLFLNMEIFRLFWKTGRPGNTIDVVQFDPLYSRVCFGFFVGWLCLHLNGMTQVNFWDAKVMHQMSWAIAIGIAVFVRMRKARH